MPRRPGRLLRQAMRDRAEDGPLRAAERVAYRAAHEQARGGPSLTAPLPPPTPTLAQDSTVPHIQLFGHPLATSKRGAPLPPGPAGLAPRARCSLTRPISLTPDSSRSLPCLAPPLWPTASTPS